MNIDDSKDMKNVTGNNAVERDKIKKMISGSAGQPQEGLTYDDTLIVLSLAIPCGLAPGGGLKGKFEYA
jgi:hypothetical protein